MATYRAFEPAIVREMPHVFGIADHFETDRDWWADTIDTSGTITAASGFGGHCIITSHSDDNDEAYRASNPIFQFAANKPLFAKIRLKYTEANTDDANVLFGLQTDLNADAMLDDGGGPATSSAYNAVWYKVDGGTTWNVRTSVNGTATTTATDYTAGGGAWTTLGIEYLPVGSARAEVSFWIDTAGGDNMVQAMEASSTRGAFETRPIKHYMTSLAGGVVGLIFGIKAGGANAEVLTVDYASCYQKL